VKHYGQVDSRLAAARPLSESERQLPELLLPREYPGNEALKTQLNDLLAYESCGCGCGSIGFEHPGGLRPGPSGFMPPVTGSGYAVVVDENGNDVGGLIVFTRHVLLDDLEVY
jgi:hypothetical protein